MIISDLWCGFETGSSQMNCWLNRYEFCQWVSVTSRKTGQVKKKKASCIQTTTGMLYRAVCRRSSERHQHLWITLYLKCATQSHPLKQRQKPRAGLGYKHTGSANSTKHWKCIYLRQLLLWFHTFKPQKWSSFWNERWEQLQLIASVLCHIHSRTASESKPRKLP